MESHPWSSVERLRIIWRANPKVVKDSRVVRSPQNGAEGRRSGPIGREAKQGREKMCSSGRPIDSRHDINIIYDGERPQYILISNRDLPVDCRSP